MRAVEVPHSGQVEKSAKIETELCRLRQEIDACRQCPLASSGQGVVHASGTADALLLVVGDYSAQSAEFSAATLFGEAEDTMLWNMMRAIGLTPEQVYVTNAVKCCPPPSGTPGDDSIRCCCGWLMREIELVQPGVVCAMGEIAARSLVATQETLVRMRGRFHPGRRKDSTGEPFQVMVTFHPRFLLKNVELKKAAWQDLQLVQQRIQAC
jgi:Uracil-DNA glycosylase